MSGEGKTEPFLFGDRLYRKELLVTLTNELGNMSYTLVVIDMQHRFRASRSNITRKHCLKEIKRAIRYKAHILYVEYEDCGSTIPSLLNASDGYDRAYTVSKSDNDGSREILSTIKRHNLPSKNFRICGVNTDACVLGTVRGLNRLTPKGTQLIVVENACNTEFSHKSGLAYLKKMNKVSLVKSR
jgi:nicotinamidase-related amidase